MTKRFSRLKYALKAIQDPNSETEANKPPTGSILYKYNEFATGSKPVEYPRDDDSKQISIETVVINPFGLGLGDSSKVLVGISKRVLNQDNLKPVVTAAGVNTTIDPLAVKLQNFKPARAIVFIEAGTQPTTKETSQITGIKYLPKAGNSYTIPYGAKTGETNERAVRAAIEAEIAKLQRASVAFKSEDL